MAWKACVHYCIQCASVYIHYTYTLCIEGRIDSSCMHSELSLLMVTVHDDMCMLKVSTKSSTNIIIPHTALILSPSGEILGYRKYFRLAAGHETPPASLQPSLSVFVLNIGPGLLSRLWGHIWKIRLPVRKHNLHFERGTWKRPCRVRLCTCIVCSAAPTFNWGKKN